MEESNWAVSYFLRFITDFLLDKVQNYGKIIAAGNSCSKRVTGRWHKLVVS